MIFIHEVVFFCMGFTVSQCSLNREICATFSRSKCDLGDHLEPI